MAAFVRAGICRVFCRGSGASQGNQASQPAAGCPGSNTEFRLFRAFELSYLFSENTLDYLLQVFIFHFQIFLLPAVVQCYKVLGTVSHHRALAGQLRICTAPAVCHYWSWRPNSFVQIDLSFDSEEIKCSLSIMLVVCLSCFNTSK